MEACMNKKDWAEEIKRLYEEESYGSSDLAEKFGVSKETIRNHLLAVGTKMRSASEAAKASRKFRGIIEGAAQSSSK